MIVFLFVVSDTAPPKTPNTAKVPVKNSPDSNPYVCFHFSPYSLEIENLASYFLSSTALT